MVPKYDNRFGPVPATVLPGHEHYWVMAQERAAMVPKTDKTSRYSGRVLQMRRASKGDANKGDRRDEK
jgi:hypothetical protein